MYSNFIKLFNKVQIKKSDLYRLGCEYKLKLRIKFHLLLSVFDILQTMTKYQVVLAPNFHENKFYVRPFILKTNFQNKILMY